MECIKGKIIHRFLFQQKDVNFLPSGLQETPSPTAPKISNPKAYILKICQIIGIFFIPYRYD